VWDASTTLVPAEPATCLSPGFPAGRRSQEAQSLRNQRAIAKHSRCCSSELPASPSSPQRRARERAWSWVK
jgi:hypothetical protein